jgi:hypothetical protein
MFNKLIAQVTNTISNRENDDSELLESSAVKTPKTSKSNKRIRKKDSDESSPEQELKRVRDKSSEISTSSLDLDQTDDSYSDGLEMNEEKLKLIIGALIKESEERTRITIQETEVRTAIHITDSLKPVQEIAEKVKIIEQSVVSLKNEVERIHDEQRKNNIIVYGLIENNPGRYEDIEKTIESLSNTLRIPTIDYDDAFRLGQPKSGQNRPLIIKLMRYKDKQRIFAAANNLKGTRISISNDKSKELRISDASLRKKKTEILKSFPSAKCQIRNQKLMVTNGTNVTIFRYDATTKGIIEIQEEEVTMQT